MRRLQNRLRQLHGWRLPTAHWIRVATRSVVLSSLLVTAALQGVEWFGGLEKLELAVFDQFVRLQPDAPPDSRLVVVAITEQDLQRYGWPLSDQVLVDSLRQLQTYQPRVIGLDLYRDLPTPPGTERLSAQLQADNVVVIENILDGIAPPAVEMEQVGFNDLTLDPDLALRRGLLFVAGSEQDYYAFALRVALAALPDEDSSFRYTDQALWIGNQAIHVLEKNSGAYQIADTRGYQTLIHYRSRAQIAPTVTLQQVLANEVSADLIRDKVVMIGTVAPSLKDFFYTPYSGEADALQMPGVIAHAQILSQLLDIAAGQPAQFRFWSQWTEWFWLMGWSVVGSSVIWCFRHPLGFGMAGLLSLGVIGGVGFWLFGQLIWIPVVEPAVGLISAFGLAMAHRLIYVTTRDPLTGVLNQGAFIRYLGWQLTHRPHFKLLPKKLPNLDISAHVGVLFLDIDRFETISKSLGLKIGDYFLCQVVDRLCAILPHSSRLARVGSDKFAIALPSDQSDRLEDLADQLQSVLAEPFWIEQQQIVTTASIGIAVTQAGYHHTPEDMLRDAHTAMYRAKSLGKARYQVFAAGMQVEELHQLKLEADLRRAIAEQEFVLYYQPIVELNTGNVSGFEALIRWQHPKLGLVSPQLFIPLAEETGLIIPLGHWICQAACEQIRQWTQQFPMLPLVISVNLSSRQFEQPDLVHQIAHTIQEAGIPAKTLKLEVTESMVMGNVEVAIDLMLRLKELGCKLSMDDFGTGYSSLSYLRRFPIDTLKVDRSFVLKMAESREDAEIVRMIIDLGHTLGMDLIAEGVETQADADQLRSLTCEFGQGYFWAKPLPPAEATALLQQQVQQQRQ
ncbi:MAG: putative bifunctional diguanylate cyclase/phosphodiesterase [Thainema sp.]